RVPAEPAGRRAGPLLGKAFTPTMKSLYRKIFWSIAPVFVGLLVIFVAVWNYTHAEPLRVFGKPLGKKFKLGVDLVGGTILVYEIDPDKKPENYNKEQLVSALKRRLDPADLYNITIRPLSDTRVEIILPTGGRHRSEAEEKQWKELLAKVEEKWEQTKGKLKVRRGDTADLAHEVRVIDDKIPVEDIDKLIRENYKVDERALTGEEVERIKDLIKRV